jgi:dCMP deaminase
MPCSMCKRLIINAGIKEVYVRDTKDDYRLIDVKEWVENDESLEGVFGY